MSYEDQPLFWEGSYSFAKDAVQHILNLTNKNGFLFQIAVISLNMLQSLLLAVHSGRRLYESTISVVAYKSNLFHKIKF